MYNKVSFNIYYYGSVRTSCTGNFCDRKRISDMTTIGGLFECCGFNKNYSNLVIQHSIDLETSNGTFILMNFHQKFSSLYLNTPIHGAAKIHQLHMTSDFIKILNCIKKCIDLINEENIFNIVGW